MAKRSTEPAAKWPKSARGCNIPLYGGQVVIVNTQDEYEQMQKWAGVFDPKQRSFGGGVCSSLEMVDKVTGAPMNRPIYLIGVYDGTAVTLAHELIHACFFVMEDVGIETPAGEPNEAFAYLHTHLMSELEKYVKQPKRNKK